MPDDSGHFFLYIGIIHSPFTSIENIQIQPSGADGYTAYAEIDPMSRLSTATIRSAKAGSRTRRRTRRMSGPIDAF